MGKGPLIVGGLLLGAGVLWATRSSAQPAPRGVVQTSVKVRRARREQWRGAVYPPPAELEPRPKFRPGQQVTVNDKDAPAGDLVQGKTLAVKELVLYEPVIYATDAAGQVSVARRPEPSTWSYVVDMVIDGQPVMVAETSLYAK